MLFKFVTCVQFLDIYSALEPRSSLPSFVRHRASASHSAGPKAKRGKQEAVKTWDKNIVCLPREFVSSDTNAIPIPRSKKRHLLGQYGLIGKVHLKSSMSEEDIMGEVRSTFAKPMGDNPLFPFRFLQGTGGGSKTLTIPPVSQSFHWTAAQVAGLGQAQIYILAEARLNIPVRLYCICVSLSSSHVKMLRFNNTCIGT